MVSSNTSHIGVEDTTLRLNPDSFGFNNYVDPDGDLFTAVKSFLIVRILILYMSKKGMLIQPFVI